MGSSKIRALFIGEPPARSIDRLTRGDFLDRTVNGLDVLDTGLLVRSGSAPSPIELVYSDATGTVDGTVVREDGLPAAGATILLFPDHLRRTSTPDYRTESTDQYGRFVVKGGCPRKLSRVRLARLRLRNVHGSRIPQAL